MKRPYHDLIQSYHAMIRRFFPSMIHENIMQDQQPICHFCYFPYETGYRQTLVLQYVFLPCVQTYQELQQPLQLTHRCFQQDNQAPSMPNLKRPGIYHELYRELYRELYHELYRERHSSLHLDDS